MIKSRKTIEIKNKFVNHLLIKGKKTKSEKIILKSFKNLQIKSQKSSKKLLQLALMYNTPIFKINTTKMNKNYHFFKKLPEEILLSSQNKSNAIERKKENQKKVFLNRHLFKYYRWH